MYSDKQINKYISRKKYIHMSEKIINNLINKKMKHNIYYPDKPNGLWFGIGNSWLNWMISEDFKYTEYNYIYELEFDKNKILKIDNENKFKKFEEQFLLKTDKKPLTLSYKTNTFMGSIDWEKVSSQYNGIEISPYFYQFRLSHLWYYGWDCASGCLWSPKKMNCNLKILYVRNSETLKWEKANKENFPHNQDSLLSKKLFLEL